MLLESIDQGIHSIEKVRVRCITFSRAQDRDPWVSEVVLHPRCDLLRGFPDLEVFEVMPGEWGTEKEMRRGVSASARPLIWMGLRHGVSASARALILSTGHENNFDTVPACHSEARARELLRQCDAAVRAHAPDAPWDLLRIELFEAYGHQVKGGDS